MATIKKQQTLIDFTLSNLGDASRVMEVLLLNDVSITAEVAAGTELQLPALEADKRKILQGFASRNIVPATLDDTVIQAAEQGIGYWIIGNNFLVS